MEPTINEYDQQAQDFLDKFNLGVKIVLSDTKPWGWGGPTPFKHHHYRISIYRTGAKSQQITFDFWGSIQDWENGESPTVYDILTSISGDQHLDSAAEVYDNFGVEGARGLDVPKIVRFAKRMQAFFTEEELAALDQIS